MLLTSPIIGLWYWCTDQYIVQRVLTARNLKEARRGTMFAGYLKLAPIFIFLLPGMIAVALYKQGVAGLRVDRRQSAGRVPGARLEPAAGRACAAWCSPACCRR